MEINLELQIVKTEIHGDPKFATDYFRICCFGAHDHESTFDFNTPVADKYGIKPEDGIPAKMSLGLTISEDKSYSNDKFNENNLIRKFNGFEQEIMFENSKASTLNEYYTVLHSPPLDPPCRREFPFCRLFLPLKEPDYKKIMELPPETMFKGELKVYRRT